MKLASEARVLFGTVGEPEVGHMQHSQAKCGRSDTRGRELMPYARHLHEDPTEISEHPSQFILASDDWLQSVEI
jgi:hypothetical protein